MTTPILEVYYDYVSPFAYMAAELLGPLAERNRCTLHWKPVDLHQLSNFSSGLPYSPSKRAYVGVDALRQAQYHGIRIAMPEPFPVQSAKAIRLALVAQDDDNFDAFHRNVFRAAWAEARDIGADEVLGDVIGKSGGDVRIWLEKARSKVIDERLQTHTAEAEGRGVFGLPMVVLDGELFWGVDSFPMLEWRLKTGKV